MLSRADVGYAGWHEARAAVSPARHTERGGPACVICVVHGAYARVRVHVLTYPPAHRGLRCRTYARRPTRAYVRLSGLHDSAYAYAWC